MPPNVGLKAKEQCESWDNFFRQTLAKEPLFSFTRTADNPINWIHFLDPFDPKKVTKDLDVEASLGKKKGFESTSGVSSFPKNCTSPSMKGSKGFGRGLEESAERVASLQIPEAVVAFAQVAAKADLLGWPLMSPSRFQMQKCEKCSLEFCSALNYRRHMRVMHRRPLAAEKEDFNNERRQLAAFWDKLTPEEANGIVASKSLILEDLTGQSVVRTLSIFLQQPASSLLPQLYIKAGASLLEIVQNKSSRLLLASQDLLNLLDESSEKTFLSFACGSMHRYMFEGEAGKVGLESKNLVASLGLLVEQNLVKAWMDNKDAEAWRCQRELVEEEEASQKKQAETQERKRSKKVRQKDIREKDRKSLDPPSGLQFSNVYISSRENCLGDIDQEGFSHAIPSSSPFSGLSAEDEVKELESFAGRYDNIYSGLADECSDKEKEHETALNESSNFLNKIMDETTETRGNTCSELQGTSLVESDGSSMKLSKACLLPEDGFTDGTDSPTGSLETAPKSPVDLPLIGSIAYNRKFKQTWVEKKWSESYQFNKNGNCSGGVVKSYDVKNAVENHGSARRPPYAAGNYTKEISSSLKMSAASRPGMFQHRSHTTTRHNQSSTGSGHAVWTRKVHKDLTMGPDKVSKSEVYLGLSSIASTNTSVQTGLNIKLESKSSESKDKDNASEGINKENPKMFFQTNISLSCAAEEYSDLEGGSNMMAVSNDVASLSSEENLLSESGSLSLFESGGFHLTSVSDKGEDNHNHCFTNLNCHVLGEAMKKSGDSLQSNSSECKSTVEVVNDLLLIGSLSIPLGKSLADLGEAINVDRFYEKPIGGTNEVGVCDRTLRNRVPTAVYEGKGKEHLMLHQESLGALLENGMRIHKDFQRDIRARTQLDPDCKENHEHLNDQLVGREVLTRSAPSSGQMPKFGSNKVWRRVGFVRNIPEILLSETKLGVSCKIDSCKAPARCDCAKDEGADNCLKIIQDSEIQIVDDLDTKPMKGRCDETSKISHNLIGCDEMGADNEEKCNGISSLDHEFQSSLNKGSMSGLRDPSYELVARFLSQRWIDAVTSQDHLVSVSSAEAPIAGHTIHKLYGFKLSEASQRKLSSFSEHHDAKNGTFHASENDAKSEWHGTGTQNGFSTLAVTAKGRFKAKTRWQLISKLGPSESKHVPK